MRCGQRGCECTTCMDCGRAHEDCICDLKARTEILILNAYPGDEHDLLDEAIKLLKEWSNV